MSALSNTQPSFEVRPFRSIEHEEGKQGQREHAGETEEKCAELWVLAVVGRVCPSRCVEKPYRRIDADPVAPLAFCVFLETVNNGEVGERALLSDWAQDLRVVSVVSVRTSDEPDYLRPKDRPLPSFYGGATGVLQKGKRFGQTCAACHPDEDPAVTSI